MQPIMISKNFSYIAFMCNTHHLLKKSMTRHQYCICIVFKYMYGWFSLKYVTFHKIRYNKKKKYVTIKRRV